ncbi:MAG TPA: SDR family NAD(P)-dependent oxidoreductase, partial [Ferruginibacter sp.]|nr:SDR family NAD(P)-dependent oxidoreductase [Ferruginibacter sp.]
MSQESAGLFSLKDKVIVVTGGTGVLGGSFVKAINRQGGIVVIIGLDGKVGDQRAAELESNGGAPALSIVANVLEESQLIIARDKIMATYGRIDGLVN